jgi:hypothetical protein
MTTAHRPTWKSAYGVADNINKGYTPTRSYSARVNVLDILGSARLFKTKIKAMGARICWLAQGKRLQILASQTLTVGKTEEKWGNINIWFDNIAKRVGSRFGRKLLTCN